MIAVRISCEQSSSMTGDVCPYVDLEVDPNYALNLQIGEQLTPLGWSFNGPTQQFCPRHNPALQGLRIELSADYIEPLPGLRLRLASQAISAGGARVKAELLLDRERYDVDEPSPGIWRAKPVGTDWPEPDRCHKCHGRGYVPDWSQGLSAEYGEPGKKSCPVCAVTTSEASKP